MSLTNKVLKHWKEILLVFGIFLIFFITRFYRLSETAVYPDEITWMVRAKETALAIKTNNFDYFKDAWWTKKDDTEAIAIPLTVMSGYPLIYLGRDQSVVSRNLMQDYISARLPIILFSSIFIVIYYFCSKKIFNKKVALVSSFMLAFDPVFVANTKLVMNDIFLTAFAFISVFSFILIKKRWLSILISSLSLTLAFLTKPNGLIVLPIILLFIFVSSINKKQDILKLIIVSIVSYILISILWPASWGNSFLAIPEYLFRQSGLVSNGINNFFFGRITNDPPFYYYVFEVLVRMPLITIASFTISIIMIFRSGTKQQKKYFSIILGFVLLFLFVISLSAKKLGIRYALPIFPWVYLLSGYGIVALMDKVKLIWKQRLIYLGIITYFVGLFVYLFPYNNLFYSLLIGGIKNSSKFDMVGLCEGSKPAVDYILRCYPKVKEIGGIGCGRSTAMYYYPHKIKENWKDEDVFYVESYYIQLQKDPELNNFFVNNIPTKVINKKGVDLAYIYVRPEMPNMCNGDTVK